MICLTVPRFNGRKDLSARERFDTKFIPVTESGCWLWIGNTNRKEYGWFHDGNKHIAAHRAAWEIFNGDIPDGMHVLHKCDVPSCVNPAHLLLGTNEDNMADRHRKGRTARGEKKKHVVTEDMVREILRSDETHAALAVRFSCGVSTIAHIKVRNTWKHVQL